MCGIAAILWAAAEDAPTAEDAKKAAVLALAGRCGIARRGPDSLDACVPAPRVALAASVLTMRSSGESDARCRHAGVEAVGASSRDAAAAG